MAAPRKYPQELRDRAVRLALDSDRPIAQIARDLGVHKEALRSWVRQAEADAGKRPEQLASAEREELKRLRKENAELKRANDILKAASALFAADLGCHRALARATGSPRLEKLYMSLGGEIRLCIAQLRPAWPSAAALADEHQAVLDVIEAGDVEASVLRMTAHLERAVRDLTRVPR